MDMLETLNYQEHGPNDVKAPVIVLIHGLFGSADNLSVIRRAFEQEYRVISLDLPNHGQSPHGSEFSFESAAQQVAQTLSKLNIKQASFVAHSLGGKVAMYLSYINPNLIDKLIVLDIAPVEYEHRHQNVIKGLSSLNLKLIKNRKDAQLSLSTYIDEVGTQSFLLKSLYQDEHKCWHWRFNLHQIIKDYPQLSKWPLSGKLVFDRPVLFIKGENSDYITAKHQASIMQQFPKAQAKIVNAGHWLHAEKPQVVNSLITKHLRG